MATVAVGRFRDVRRGNSAMDWTKLAIAVWLFISPWVLGSAYANMTALDWNFWAVGAAVFFLSAAELSFMLGTRTLVARERVSAMPERDLSYAGERPRER